MLLEEASVTGTLQNIIMTLVMAEGKLQYITRL